MKGGVYRMLTLQGVLPKSGKSFKGVYGLAYVG